MVVRLLVRRVGRRRVLLGVVLWLLLGFRKGLLVMRRLRMLGLTCRGLVLRVMVRGVGVWVGRSVLVTYGRCV